MDTMGHYQEIWLVDFEFRSLNGERPEPICMVAREYRSGRTLRVWADELANRAAPPFPTGDDVLFVAYYASAECGCFLSLGWPMPRRILDLFCEFRHLTNGQDTVSGNGLLGAMAHFGLGGIAVAEKVEMRELALRGGPYTEAEQSALLDYCETDVVALTKLLPAMLPKIDLARALLRGRYMAAVARMEWNGTPIDVTTLESLRSRWDAIKGELVERVDTAGIFVAPALGAQPAASKKLTRPIPRLSFSSQRFAEWLAREGIPWPRLDSGKLVLDDDTFREMARAWPAIAPLRELRHTLGEMRLFSDLAVGSDGRIRCLLSPFRSITGRNQPSNAQFMFGPSAWLRSLIQPEPGMAIAYVDWSQQEFGIAAALSADQAMMDAYSSGDPYLAFAKQARAVPPDATKVSHPAERERFKACVLAVQYGMGAKSLAQRIDQPEPYARELLRLHRQTYPGYWKWSEAAVNHAMLGGWLRTVFGWQIHVGARVNPRSLANFPMQANGAEMLRLACCLLVEQGIRVCCPIHDAVLVEGPVDEIDAIVNAAERAMVEASRIVLDGFGLRSDTKIVRYPERYCDPRGEKMWETVMSILDGMKLPIPTDACEPSSPNPRTHAGVTPARVLGYIRTGAAPYNLISYR